VPPVPFEIVKCQQIAESSWTRRGTAFLAGHDLGLCGDLRQDKRHLWVAHGRAVRWTRMQNAIVNDCQTILPNGVRLCACLGEQYRTMMSERAYNAARRCRGVNGKWSWMAPLDLDGTSYHRPRRSCGAVTPRASGCGFS
jgi:hypothetical protein